VTKSIPFAALAALFTIGAVRADAQITTVITPPKPPAEKQLETARRQEAARDSVARVTLTDMKEWVDSAAASLALRPDTAGAPVDTGVAAPAPPMERSDARAARNAPRQQAPATEFREGGRAPDTATMLPTLALAGGVAIVLGFALRRRAARSAARARR
jgi:hypothetical protein